MNAPADILQRMQSQLFQAGLVVDQVEADGEIHRCGVAGKERGKDGSYKAYLDAPASLWWMNWRTGDEGTWHDQTVSQLTAEEQEALKERTRQARIARDKERDERYQSAAQKALYLWNKLDIANSDHSYLKRKGIDVLGEVRLTNTGRLVLPLWNEKGELTSLQYIDGNGEKNFLAGGRTAGSFCEIPASPDKSNGPLLLCEGYATGASLHMATGYACVIAFNCGNLLPVAKTLRGRYPNREIILCADKDINTKKPDGTPYNPGKEEGHIAAEAIGAKLALCPAVNGRSTDFNDLHAAQGLEAVRRVIEAARNIVSPKGKRPLRCLNIADFITKEYPPRDMLLAPVMAVQSLNMVFAQRGIGKTYFSLSVAYAVASGGAVFGRWFAPSPARVLYIDGEMPAVTLQHRLQSIAAGAESDIHYPDLLRIITPDEQDEAMPNLATKEGQEAVEPFLEGVKLVVVDNLATLARTGKANDEDSWLPVQEWLLSLRRRGISVLLVHHAGKNGTQRGTGAKEDILDTVLELKRPNDYRADEGARFEVHFSKARGLTGDDCEPFEAQLSLDEAGNFAWLTRRVEDAEEERVRELLREGNSERDVAEETGVNKSRVHRIREKMIREGEKLSDSKGGASTHKKKFES